MSSLSSARGALRTATAAYHDRVDALFSRMDLTDRDDYARFLQAQAAAHLPAEAALTRAGAAALVPDWASRCRAALLIADLAELGVAVPDDAAQIAFADDAAVLGGVYVLEGSRLGGAMLARAVPPAFPRAFLASNQSGNWRGLLDILQHRLVTPDDHVSAVESASRVFMLFESSGLRYLRAD